ncbi:MAG TPA: hypothetical protein VII56_10675 [Rhizomicrobium sp.]
MDNGIASLRGGYTAYVNPERPFSAEPDPLQSNRAMKETLAAWLDRGENAGPLSFAEVVRAMADSRALALAVRKFLSPGSPAFDIDPEVALDFRQKLAWALVDQLFVKTDHK